MSHTNSARHTYNCVFVFSGPLPMEDIARMADECMRDVDEDDDDDNVEDDEDLMVGVCIYSSF